MYKITKTAVANLLAISLFVTMLSTVAYAQKNNALKITMPASGKLQNNKPAGKGWVSLLDTSLWVAETQYWQLNNGVLHGETNGQDQHHFGYTKKTYKDFELNVLIKMTGNEGANSGVCIRLHPTSFDNVPGYQVDMGKGYWGSLWEEHGAGMVQKYPDSLVTKLVKANDWNHYYIIAKGHHIQAWLNGVKTIDIIHESGSLDGRIGIQLDHGKDRHTIIDVKAMYVKEL